MLRPALPYVYGAGTENAAVLKYSLSVFGPSVEPDTLGRFDAPFELALSKLIVGVKGWPLLELTIPLICHPPNTLAFAPVLANGLPAPIGYW
jgi:hypothetical protein